MEPLKEMFNETYFNTLTEVVKSEYALLNKKKFIDDLLCNLKDKELNERMSHTSLTLGFHLPRDFKASIRILDKVVSKMKTGYTSMVFPDFVSKFGMEHMDFSLEALKRYTVFGSSEFAIRVFLKKDFDKTITAMNTWAEDPNLHVRRLSSEGSRPRLPWSFKLDQVISNPHLTKQILVKLKSDPELYVRKSVANHLNDISKDHPEYMIALVKTWDQSNADTAWIIKHASRTLIKQGHPKALKLFDAHSQAKVNLHYFTVSPSKLKLGEKISIHLGFKSTSRSPQKLIIDYIVHYVKKQGGSSPKVFKWTELTLLPGQEIELIKNQKIIDFTTRVHHPGIHKIEIQINGRKLAESDFNLLE